MSEELGKALHDFINKTLPGYKGIVLEAFGCGEATVPVNDSLKLKRSTDLVGSGVLQFSKVNSTGKYYCKNYVYIYTLTDKGKDIAVKLISERNRPHLG